MLETTRQVFDIQTVRTIQPSYGALVVAFGSGLVARFPPEHPGRDSMFREAESSLEEGRPVGVMENGDGRILELSHAFGKTRRTKAVWKSGFGATVPCAT